MTAARASARQVSPVASQMGVPPEQLAFVTQPTQWFVSVSQTGVAPVHAEAFDDVQVTQVPVLAPCVEHAEPAALPTHCASVVQGLQVELSHAGFGFEHWVLEVHPTQESVAVLQVSGDWQLLLCVHCTHSPLWGSELPVAHTPDHLPRRDRCSHRHLAIQPTKDGAGDEAERRPGRAAIGLRHARESARRIAP